MVFLALFAWVIFIGTKVWYYYDRIRSGEIVALPQFASKFTAGKGGFGKAAPAIERALVESKDDPSFGAAEPALTIVEFADFECPYSREVSTAVRTLAAKYKDRVKFVYRDYPLSDVHTQAFPAALAAECAAEQGKFWAFHDKLFANPDKMTYADLLRYGEETGLETRQFERCLADERYKAEVEADIAAGGAISIRGTPTFFFNGNRIEGAIPQDTFEQVIEKLLQ